MKNAIVFVLFFPIVLAAQDYSIDFIPDSLPALPGKAVRYRLRVLNNRDTALCLSSMSDEGKYYLSVKAEFDNIDLENEHHGIDCMFGMRPERYPGGQFGAFKTCFNANETTVLLSETQITPTKIEYYDGRELFLNIKFHAIDCKDGSFKTFEQRVAVKTIKLTKPEREYWGSQVKVEEGDYKIKMVKTRFDLAAANRLIKRCKKCETVPVVHFHKVKYLSQDSLTIPQALYLARERVKLDSEQPHFIYLLQLYMDLIRMCMSSEQYYRCTPRASDEEYDNAKTLKRPN